MIKMKITDGKKTIEIKIMRWTGKKDNPGERKLVLKWVATSFVGAAQEQSPIVLHHVKAGEKNAD